MTLSDADQAAILDALEGTDRFFREALPKFNYGASALDANACRLLNETPPKVRLALSILKDDE